MKKAEITLSAANQYLKLLKKQNSKLERKLLIARRTLNTYSNPCLWQHGVSENQRNLEGFYSTHSISNSFILNPIRNGWESAQTALKEIKETR